MTDFEKVEQLLSETLYDEFFYDSRDEDVSKGSCTIKGTIYEWQLTLDDARRVRISYKEGTGAWHRNCTVDAVDVKLLDFLRKMATTVIIIRDVQNEPKDMVYSYGYAERRT